jgi:hypothetical protein
MSTEAARNSSAEIASIDRRSMVFLGNILGVTHDFVGGTRMKARFFYSAAILIFFGAIYLLTKAMDLMNRPSNAALTGGILIVVALFILVPSAFTWAWHHHVTPHGKPVVRITRNEEDRSNADRTDART